MAIDMEELRDEYSDDVEFLHARLQLEIGKAASRGLAGNVRFIGKMQARHHVLKGLLKGRS